MARRKNPKVNACRWTMDEHDGSWDTECGDKHQFSDGGPKENNHRFCPYCGLRLSVELE